MALDNYGNLQSAIGNWLNRGKLSRSEFDTIVVRANRVKVRSLHAETRSHGAFVRSEMPANDAFSSSRYR